MPATTADTLSLVNRSVTVAPLVLLSVADHYGRTAKGTRKRVVGVLLGENSGDNVRVSNSFAGECKLSVNRTHTTDELTSVFSLSL
jgi:26S proteasome regulatory subunit N8